MSLVGLEVKTSCTLILCSTRLAVASCERFVPHPFSVHTIQHSPHYIAEVTFQNVEPTEFVF